MKKSEAALLSISSEQRFEDEFVRPRPGRTLIAGSFVVEGKADRRLLYPAALGVDMRPGPGVDVVADLEQNPGLGLFSHIECMSVLEHVRQPWLMAKVLEDMLEPGGTIYVAVPFNWNLHAYPDDYWRMSVSAVRSLFEGIEWGALKYATHARLTDELKGIPATKVDGYRYLARSMTCGFGVKR